MENISNKVVENTKIYFSSSVSVFEICVVYEIMLKMQSGGRLQMTIWSMRIAV
jgi:hypothetical protein